ncbi:MAG: hypothetical protein ACI31A_00890, partial [Candidatus Limisoma sp.]
MWQTRSAIARCSRTWRFFLSALHSPQVKDLFEEKKRKAWKELDVAEARCDFAPNRMRITNRGGVFFITLWKKSVYGRTLTDIKGD